MKKDYLPIAVRVYTEWHSVKKRVSRPWVPPQHTLVIDTESTTDASQRFTFGSYRYLRMTWESGVPVASCVEEGLIYSDDLPAQDSSEFAILHDYVVTHSADIVPGVNPRLRLLSRREFVNSVLYLAACKALATVVTFNALFDITRLAIDVKRARGRFEGGFSLVLWEHLGVNGTVKENKYRPRVTVKNIDSKRALKRFTKPRNVEVVDLVPVGPTGGQPNEVVVFGGEILDLRQLVYTLTDEGHSLESACKTFGVPFKKRNVRHGKITVGYINYNREDVWATTELYLKVMEEYVQCVPSC